MVEHWTFNPGVPGSNPGGLIAKGMVVGKLGTFVALGVRGRGMIENRSFNLVEFCVIMGKTNRDLSFY